ncbi:T3SS effector HopA1 family protein [Flavobacterium sp.]|uniref:T3SS effector HopA1 family protein n=1 Tax=Flavobacterium sp. TaxID=239 RepID=UPI003D6B448E
MFQDKTTLEELTSLIEQLELSDFHITFRGKQYAVTPENATEGLVNILYSECYALKETHQKGLAKRENGIVEVSNEFINQLSANNHSKDREEQGWQIKSNYSNGYVEVIKEGKTKAVRYSELKDLPNGFVPAIGQTVTVYFSKEDKERQPSFYYVFSNCSFDFSKKMTRIYWNINSNGAALLIDNITKKLNYYNIPFLFKCLNHPDFYFRRDAAVLYVEDGMMRIVKSLLPEICELMEEYLDDDVPLFTYRYNKGVGIAESPNTQESFGMNRVGIVAGALINSMQLKEPSENIIKQIETAFLKKGINPSTPFLNKGSRILFN